MLLIKLSISLSLTTAEHSVINTYVLLYICCSIHTSLTILVSMQNFCDVAKIGILEAKLDTDGFPVFHPFLPTCFQPCFAKKGYFIPWIKMMLHLPSCSFNLLILTCSLLFFCSFWSNCVFSLKFLSYIIQFVSHLIPFVSLHRRLVLESSWGSLLQPLPAGASPIHNGQYWLICCCLPTDLLQGPVFHC